MTILVDTSVWSLSLRKDGPANHPAVEKLQGLILDAQNIVLLGIILQEILQGFKQASTFSKANSYLDAFPLLTLNRSDFVAAAQLRRQATAKGATLSTPDCQIAAASINHQCHKPPMPSINHRQRFFDYRPLDPPSTRLGIFRVISSASSIN